MKRGDLRIRIIDGNKIKMAYLGKGAFCEAWQNTEDDMVYTWHKLTGNHDDTGSKESIAMWADTDNPHVPNLKCLNNEIIRGYEFSVFRVPFYENLTAKKYPTCWKQRKLLADIWDICWDISFYHDHTRHVISQNGIPIVSPYAHDIHSFFRDEIRIKKNLDVLGMSLIEAIDTISDAVLQYGDDYFFEFNKANVGVDTESRLVLRDVLYSQKALLLRRQV